MRAARRIQHDVLHPLLSHLSLSFRIIGTGANETILASTEVGNDLLQLGNPLSQLSVLVRESRFESLQMEFIMLQNDGFVVIY